MTTVEQEAWAAAEAAPRDAEGHVDLDVYKAEFERRLAEYERQRAERRVKLMRDARAVHRAMEGWGTVKTQDDWDRTVRQAADELERGRFLINRLGAERYLDPPLIAVLLTLRRRLIEEHGATTAAELMLIDLALISYFHTLRINGWIGNFASLIEHEFFGQESLTAKLEHSYGRGTRVKGLRVEDFVECIAEQLMPLLDRSNRMMLRNLKALKAMREGPGPSVSIGSAGQVNVAAQQVNAATDER